MQDLWIDRIDSPLGQILIITNAEALCALEFEDYEARTLRFLERRYGAYQFIPQSNPFGISDRIRAYLAGEYQQVEQIPVSPGGTAFQQQVWLMLRTIPVGTVLTYGQLAERLHKPTASRAVGMANSQNPISIVLPCHRVIGANGMLTGYAGGLERKAWLLRHEGVELKKSLASQQLSLI